MPSRRGKGRRGLRPATLAKMNNEQLSKAGYIRVSGFTRADGTKVKSHIRKLNLSEIAKAGVDKASDALMASAKYLTEATIGNLHGALKGDKESIGKIADFTPVISDIRLYKESVDALSKGDIVEGSLLGVAGTAGLFPVVGDVVAKAIKGFATSLKKVKEIKKIPEGDIAKKLAATPHSGWAKEAEKLGAGDEVLMTGKNKIDMTRMDDWNSPESIEKAIRQKSDEFVKANTKKTSANVKEAKKAVAKSSSGAVKLGKDLNLGDVKKSIQDHYKSQGKNVDVYFNQTAKSGLKKGEFELSRHLNSGKAGYSGHLGDEWELASSTYGSKTYALIVDKSIPLDYQGVIPGSGLKEVLINNKALIEVQEVTKNISSYPSIGKSIKASAGKRLENAKLAHSKALAGGDAKAVSKARNALLKAAEDLRLGRD